MCTLFYSQFDLILLLKYNSRIVFIQVSKSFKILSMALIRTNVSNIIEYNHHQSDLLSQCLKEVKTFQSFSAPCLPGPGRPRCSRRPAARGASTSRLTWKDLSRLEGKTLFFSFFYRPNPSTLDNTLFKGCRRVMLNETIIIIST